MQTSLLRVGFLIAFPVWVASSATAATAEISELDRYLPEDTMVYFAVNDISAAKKAAEVTAFYEVWDSAGMKNLRAQMSAMWNRNVVEKIQFDPLGLLEAMKEDAVVGATLRAYGSPSDVLPMVVLAMHDPENRVKQIVTAIQALKMISGKKDGPEISSYKHKEADVTTVPLDDGEFSIATLPGIAIACVGPPKLITEILDQGSKKEPAGFMTAEMYAPLVGFHQNEDLAFAWIDVQTTLRTILSAMSVNQPNIDLGSIFNVLGIDNCQQYVMRYSVAHRGFFQQQIIDFDGPMHGVLRFFFEPGTLEAGARFTPASDLIMVASHGSLTEAWGQWKEFIKTAFGQEALTDMEVGVQAVEATLGFSFENELFPTIGNEIALGFEGERFTVLIQTLDEKTISEIVPKLLLLWELTPESMETDGIAYNRVDAPDIGTALYYGTSDGYLILSNTPDGYLSVAKGPEEGESILESRRYGRALSYLPAPNHFVTITDLRGIASYTTALMRFQQAASGNEAPAGLDLSFLADQTYPIVEVGVAQEDRITRWAYSESGVENMLTVFSIFNAVMQNFEKGSAAATMGRCRSEMRSIVSALESYFIDNNEYPEKLEDLTAPVAFLKQIPEDPWTGKPYLYQRRGKTYILIAAGPDRKVNFNPDSVEGSFTSDKIPEDARTDETGQKPGDIIIVGP